MTARLTRVLAAVAIPALSLVVAVAAPGQQPALTTARGVYSTVQAAEGEALYKGACASCHGDNLMGTFEVPTLTGRFVGNWSNGSVGTLFTYVSDAMPQMAPGTLSPEDNAKIVAYLLKANGMPAGPQPLPSDRAALDRIAFVPVGPLH
ncbi:MAG: cytochrome c [Sphingobium sp.]|nr:cytochrome c [Sphingobium sp.]